MDPQQSDLVLLVAAAAAAEDTALAGKLESENTTHLPAGNGMGARCNSWLSAVLKLSLYVYIWFMG